MEKLFKSIMNHLPFENCSHHEFRRFVASLDEDDSELMSDICLVEIVAGETREAYVGCRNLLNEVL